MGLEKAGHIAFIKWQYPLLQRCSRAWLQGINYFAKTYLDYIGDRASQQRKYRDPKDTGDPPCKGISSLGFNFHGACKHRFLTKTKKNMWIWWEKCVAGSLLWVHKKIFYIYTITIWVVQKLWKHYILLDCYHIMDQLSPWIWIIVLLHHWTCDMYES